MTAFLCKANQIESELSKAEPELGKAQPQLVSPFWYGIIVSARYSLYRLKSGRILKGTMMGTEQNMNVLLPRYSSVRDVILKYSSPLCLNTGARFRVCNVCGGRLDFTLSKEHVHHLKKHTKSWQSYKKKVGEFLKDALENDTKPKENKQAIIESESESSSSDSEDFFNCKNVIGTLGNPVRPPPWTVFERKQLSKFTYDKNPIKDFREFSDIHVVSYCNFNKYQQINKLINKESSIQLDAGKMFDPNSTTVNRIARMLCEKQCYYNPNACFYDDEHTFDFRDLMKKEVHDNLNPNFENILNEQSGQNVVLKYDDKNWPEIGLLCEEIGFTTNLIYNKKGYLDLNYDLFCNQLWDYETPLFALEQKKVLDIILALLIAASRVHESKRDSIEKMYAQNVPGLNKPVLALMLHGPGIHGFSNPTSENCDTNLRSYNEHKKCKNYTQEDYWKFKHSEEISAEETECVNELSKCGPATLLNPAIVYPCIKGHWHACECVSCSLLRRISCNNHKVHMQHNIKKCLIKEAVDCGDHQIDHPENVKKDDIVMMKNLFYHNRELTNFTNEKVTFAGKKSKCKKCRENVKDHFENHNVFHVHCDLCVHESKSSVEPDFWEKVCKICGKKYETERLKDIHFFSQHKLDKEQCDYCGKQFNTKFTFQRHLVEQHQVHQQANNGHYDGTKEDEELKYACKICTREFKYKRNIYAHMHEVHYRQFTCQCSICGKELSKQSNLKRHLQEQHDIYDMNRELPREISKSFICLKCGTKFLRKSNLLEHVKIHDEKRTRYKCSHCEDTFSVLRNLRRHERIHSSEWKVNANICHFCNAEFVSKWNLKQHLTTHERQVQEFKCKKCGKTFHAKRTLTRHLLIHH